MAAPSPSRLPTTDPARTGDDTQRTEFIKAAYEKEAEAYGIKSGGGGLKPEHMAILDRLRAMNAAPVTTVYPGSNRTEEQLDASRQIHKRVNPGYVDMPYKATTALAYEYKPPPDFSRNYLKKKSDCDFQGFAAEAILKHVELNKTSH